LDGTQHLGIGFAHLPSPVTGKANLWEGPLLWRPAGNGTELRKDKLRGGDVEKQ